MITDLLSSKSSSRDEFALLRCKDSSSALFSATLKNDDNSENNIGGCGNKASD